MFYFDRVLTANSRNLAEQWQHVGQRRDFFDQMQANMQGMPQGNQAARIPTDVYRDIDSQTKKLMTGDEGGVLMAALMPLAKALPVGKIVAEYRRVSDSGNGNVSINGQAAKIIDKAVYDFDGALVLVHDDAYGRQWREVEGQRSEAFDALIDDSENSVRTVRRSLVSHFVNGVSNVKYKERTAPGIKSQAYAIDLGTSGLNIDLTSGSLTWANCEKAFIAFIQGLKGSSNNAEGRVKIFVSSQIWFNLQRTDGSGVDKQTFFQALMKMPDIMSIESTNDTSVLNGNQVLGFIPSSQYIQPVIGMATTTTPIVRMQPWDNYNFVTWSVAGILVKSDYANRKGVFYARNMT